MKYKIVEKEAFKIVGIKDRFSHVDNLGASVGNMWASTPQETMEKIMALSNVEPVALVGTYSEMYEDNTTITILVQLQRIIVPPIWLH